jgi:hypothetical protein
MTMNASRRTLVILTLAAVAVSAIISVTYFADFNRNNSSSLPAGCVRPADGFLIIASKTGFNDSMVHGAPAKPWPLITVHQGQNVTIVVCNVDGQAHGFQIAHYFDKTIETIGPGQVVPVRFVADKEGSYTVYCDIPCSIHAFMQDGLLNVTP